MQSFITGLSIQASSVWFSHQCRPRGNMLAELSRQVVLGLTALKYTILVGLLKIGSTIPYVKERIQEFEERHVLVPYQNFWHTYGSNKMLTVILKIALGDVKKTARLGTPAPNCKLVSTDGKECRLLDFARGSRPLVVNFGSYTWPPFFINLMNNFTKVVREFEDVADFVVVYICEAHPTDEWRWNVSDFVFVPCWQQTYACHMLVHSCPIPVTII